MIAELVHVILTTQQHAHTHTHTHKHVHLNGPGWLDHELLHSDTQDSRCMWGRGIMNIVCTKCVKERQGESKESERSRERRYCISVHMYTNNN